MSSNNAGNNAAPSGMGKSAPLVQIQSTPPVGQSVAIHDHPLAAAPVSASSQQEPSTAFSGKSGATTNANNNRRLATPASIMTSMTLSSMAPPPTGAATVAVPKAIISPSPPLGGLQSQSTDDLADAFLKGHDAEANPNALLRPKPLPETQTELERVRILVERRAWGDVLSVTNSLLKGGGHNSANNNNATSTTSHYGALYAALLKNTTNTNTNLLNPAQVDEFAELLLLQGHALMQMRRFKELGAEVHEWTPCHVYTKQQPGDKPELPWKICVFAAASLQYTLPQHKDAATTALWKVRQDILAVLNNQDNIMDRNTSPIVSTTKLDLLHVDLTLSNILVAQEEFRVAVECLDRILGYLSEAAGVLQEQHKLTNDEASTIQEASKAEILTRQARILLQVGALDGAYQLFERTQSLLEHVPPLANKQELYCKFPQSARLLEQAAPQLETGWGLWHFAQKQEASYNVALEHFRKALQLMSENTNELAGQYLSTDWLGGGLVAPLARHVLYAETSNNIAVTALYTCRLQEAVHVLEGIIRQNPSEALTERSALNLCTLYELCGDAASSTRKKKTLQMIAKRFFLHDIGPESFRL